VILEADGRRPLPSATSFRASARRLSALAKATQRAAQRIMARRASDLGAGGPYSVSNARQVKSTDCRRAPPISRGGERGKVQRRVAIRSKRPWLDGSPGRGLGPRPRRRA
jgi:hypothetical protein